MQVHHTRPAAPDEDYPVRAGRMYDSPVAVITIGPVVLWAESADDAGRLMRAGAEAKRLLTEPEHGGSM